MYTEWFKHLQTAEDQLAFQREVKGAKPVLDHLINMLKNRANGIEASEMSVQMFDVPNWDYRQAYLNGFKACLSSLVKLIDLDQQEHK